MSATLHTYPSHSMSQNPATTFESRGLYGTLMQLTGGGSRVGWLTTPLSTPPHSWSIGFLDHTRGHAHTWLWGVTCYFSRLKSVLFCFPDTGVAWAVKKILLIEMNVLLNGILIYRWACISVKSTQVRLHTSYCQLAPLPLLVKIWATVRIFLGAVFISIPKFAAKGTGSISILFRINW